MPIGDKAHPLGYGRLEYVSSLIVTMLIMYMGIRSIIGSVQVIMHPARPPEYGTAIILIMIASMFFKVCYGGMMRRRGRKLNSVSMIMTGTESMGDALVSAAILLCIFMRKSEYGIPASAKGLALCNEEGLIDATVAEANAKITSWCSFPLDPTFESGELKNTDGVYQDVFEGLSYKEYSVEEAAPALFDGVTAVLNAQ